jgi:hypothetical protein
VLYAAVSAKKLIQRPLKDPAMYRKSISLGLDMRRYLEVTRAGVHSLGTKQISQDSFYRNPLELLVMLSSLKSGPRLLNVMVHE